MTAMVCLAPDDGRRSRKGLLANLRWLMLSKGPVVYPIGEARYVGISRPHFFLAFVGSLVALLFKSVRRKAKWIAPASFAAMIVATAFLGGEQSDEARRLGFLDAADQRAAKDAGVTDPVAWR